MTNPMLDRLILGFDRTLRTLAGTATSSRPVPGAALPASELTAEETRHAAGLMRVNHTGELMRVAASVMKAVAYRI
jgi:ubiquinone biosynthesis monooxygenase Coq7